MRIFPLKRFGVTLMELLIAIPMFAFVGVGIGYHLGVAARLTQTQIAWIKCNVAATNLLSLIQADSPAHVSETLSVHVGASGFLKTTSPAHPDGLLGLKVTTQSLANPDTQSGVTPIFWIKVECPAFEVAAKIQTYFSADRF
ncbi:MAG: hypothetical protein WA705_24660 [Candidatus Ozemobacteraceae bacterium]